MFGAPNAPDIPVNAMPAREWIRVPEVNRSAVLHHIAPALPGMQARRSEPTIDIASMAPRASKATVINTTKAVAFEVTHRGITENTIMPGKIETTMIHATAKANIAVARALPADWPDLPETAGQLVSFQASCGAARVASPAIELNGDPYMWP